ncbi:MAG: shikimate kinase [Sulfurovaceae bacterium]|nr:shikimate kinase [Sulfurovaceae bacterium]
MDKNIILIGFMGVGKGTIARAYAKAYGVYNIDTDDLIVSKVKKEVKKIFEQYGEERFRALEQETANWIEANVKGTLISCGGGFYKVNNLKNLGTVVLLDASFEWIHKRLKNAKNSKAKLAKRPLFAKEKEAKKLYNERAEIYRQVADIIINVEKLSTKEIVEQINKVAI